MLLFFLASRFIQLFKKIKIVLYFIHIRVYNIGKQLKRNMYVCLYLCVISMNYFLYL